MKAFLGSITGVFKNHKFKIFLTLVFAVVFVIILFPFDDLSDAVSAKVSQVSGNTVYLQFDGLSLDLFPSLGLTVQNVKVEGPGFSPVAATKVSASPWIIGLLSGRQGGSFDADGIFSGQISADVRDGDKLPTGDREKNISVNAANIKLENLASFLRDSGLFGFNLLGAAKISTQMSVDPQMTKQPEGTIDLEIANFVIPSQTVVANMIPIALSEMNLGTTKLDAKMGEGRIEIQDLKFGDAGGPLVGQAHGQMLLSLKRLGASVQPVLTNYDVTIDLTISKEMLDNGGFAIQAMTALIQNYKKETPQGSHYAFRMRGTPLTVPEFSGATIQ